MDMKKKKPSSEFWMSVTERVLKFIIWIVERHVRKESDKSKPERRL